MPIFIARLRPVGSLPFSLIYYPILPRVTRSFSTAATHAFLTEQELETFQHSKHEVER
jgi:hypothetical protein